MQSRKGMFGQIEVTDYGDERALFLNGQKQGGAYFRPSAQAVDQDLSPGEPGPVCSSMYALGWLIAGLMNPWGSGLMVGLGSGAGAIQLLYNFPQVDLTVVEIDPTMAQVALEEFPLLVYYMDRGRLNIEVEDAQVFLANTGDQWDFGCADAYDGGQELIHGSISGLCQHCDHLYVNCIDRLDGRSMQQIASVAHHMSKPVVEVFKASRFFDREPYGSRSNWVMTSQEPDMQLLTEFTPFVDLEGVHVLDLQRDWDALMAGSLSEVI